MITDITDTRCVPGCCYAAHETTCTTGHQCLHHARDYDRARAKETA